MSTAVVVPVRSFVLGKERLGRALTDDVRAAFASDMAAAVVGAAGERPVVIVSSAPEVVALASALGAACIDDPGSLDGAASAGRAWSEAHGHARTIIAHGDLPLVTSFDDVEGHGRLAIIVPDHRDDGNPVLSIPSDIGFAFSYGPGSAARHVAEARRHGLDVQVVRDPSLGFDVDTPLDLDELRARRAASPR